MRRFVNWVHRCEIIHEIQGRALLLIVATDQQVDLIGVGP